MLYLICRYEERISTEMQNFNYTDKYYTEIDEKVKEIKTLCLMYKIPFFFAFAVENTNHSTKYVSELLSAGAQSLKLTDNKFPDLVNVMNGFGTYLKNNDDVNLDVLREIPEEIIKSDYSSIGEEEDTSEDEYYGDY